MLVMVPTCPHVIIGHSCTVRLTLWTTPPFICWGHVSDTNLHGTQRQIDERAQSSWLGNDGFILSAIHLLHALPPSLTCLLPALSIRPNPL